MTSNSTRHMAAFSTLFVFSVMSLATSKPKGEGPNGKDGAAAAAGSSGALPTGTLIGACDRSDTYQKYCSENYAPATFKDEAAKCKKEGGHYRAGPCPRLKAVSQCFQGNPPHLFGYYKYDAAKPSKPEECTRGFKDLVKSPDLVASSQPASCNAVKTGGVCIEFSAVTADSESLCLSNGGVLKQPSEPCPRTNGLLTINAPTHDGTQSMQYYYTTPYDDGSGEGPKTQSREDLAMVCALAGCKLEAFPDAPAAAKNTAKPAGKAPAGAPKPPAKPPAKK